MGLGSLPNELVALIMEHSAALAIKAQSKVLTMMGALGCDLYSPVDLYMPETAALVFASTSRRFRAVSLHLPVLWTTITDRMPRGMYMSFLERSLEKPLTVVICRHKQRKDMELFLLSTVEHYYRWSSLHVVIPMGQTDDQWFTSLLDRGFPVLSSITVVNNQRLAVNQDILLLSNNPALSYWEAPLLDSAQIKNFVPRSSVLPSLTTLAWTLEGRHRFPVNVRATLACCVSLRTLRITLDDWHLAGGAAYERSAGLEPACLETVESFALEFRSVAFSTIEWLISALRLPRLESLTIKVSRKWGIAPYYPLRELLDTLFSPGLGALDVRKIRLCLSGIQFIGTVDDMTVVTYLFREHRLTSLRQLILAQSSFASGRAVRRIRSGPPKELRHFPASLKVLDLTGVNALSSEDAKELIRSLCEAKSKATLHIREASLYARNTLGTQTAIDDVKAYCTDVRMLGLKTFDIHWYVDRARRGLAATAVD